MFRHASLTRASIACAISFVFLSAIALLRVEPAALGCKAGYENVAGHGCVNANLVDARAEAHERASDPGREGIPAGTLRRAVEQKAAMKTAKAAIANSDVHWTPYGSGPQVGDPLYQDGYRDGIRTVSGRADSFAYDPIAKRLFVAIGEGGIWMSEATDGDVGTLADHWVSISDTLPSLITSAVGWTAARGGRVIALAGDHVQGGNTYVGLGAYWSDDLGAHWHHSLGVPDSVGATKVAVDLSNPNIVYAATHKGLFRSDDAGETFTNVALPVSDDCAGAVDFTGACQLANVVTDVVIRQPGGIDASGLDVTQCATDGCAVLTAVGYRSGTAPYADGKPQSPGNGLYRSETGKPGTFVRLDGGSIGGLGAVPVGFTPQIRVGRVEMGAAEGPLQNHNWVYAIVQDAVLLNGGIPILDLPGDEKEPSVPIDCSQFELVPFDPGDVVFVCQQIAKGYNPTAINGVYVSQNFGLNWTRLADDIELTYNLSTGSSLVGAVALGIGPGVQSWYDLWVKPDPTQALGSIPTRLAFGMEEIWKNRLNIPQDGIQQTPNDYKVFGTYFAGTTCLFLIGQIGPPTPVCPTYDGVVAGTTTHPDQHDGIYIPDDQRGGVWLIVGNDGGVFKQYSGDPTTDDFANNKWGNGANEGFHTLFHYGIGVAKDGTVYYGNQDNASGKIEPNGRHLRIYVGDGVYAAVDPDNSQTAYYQTPELSIVRTTDGGITNTSISPADGAAGTAHFLSPFVMDPLDATHLVAAGTKVAETLNAPADDQSWTTVFEFGTDDATGFVRQSRSRTLDTLGDATYAGWCGPCQPFGGTTPFQRGIATNVGGDKPPAKGTSDGWHQASAIGLPNRYIYNIKIDPSDARTIYVALGGYSTARWLPPGQYEDTNTNIGSGHVFVSHDAGEHFTDISGNLPDIVTDAVVRYGDQLIVGTDIGAFISSDLDGSNWAPLGDLPNVPISQFVFHPADPDVLFAATFGRGTQVVHLSKSIGGGGGTTTSTSDTTRFGGALPLASLMLLFGAGLLRRRRS